jgi:outer membrane protein assembly factor BamB
MRFRRNRKALVAIAAIVGLALPFGVASAARAASSPACDTSWPTFQHDQSRTGAACGGITTTNVATLVPGWFDPTPNAVTAEPAVVGATMYVGDNGGVFHALSASTGATRWTFDVTQYDHHATSYGVITSSATYSDQVAGHRPVVVFGGGGSVFALDASSGALVWHTDLAPSHPTGPDEVESSPVVVPDANGTGLVLVGLDTNESTQGISGGLVALNAQTGAPLWSYEPGTGTTNGGLPQGAGDGCSDIWSSPAVDPTALSTGMVFFGTGNCPDGQASIQAISLRGGKPLWSFPEPAANHGTDDDFGSSPVLGTINTATGPEPVVVEAGKSGWIYVLNEYTGAIVNSHEVAQPGQTGDNLAGAIGGFIGSIALAPVNRDPVAFGDSAIPAPFSGDGITSSSATPDTSLATDPTRISSLHAYDIATGKVLWQEPLQAPAYAPVTETGGVVFAPSTTSFSIQAFEADNGVPLWHFPLASSASGGVAISGSSIFFGTGTYESPGTPVPPQATGIWMFHPAGS